MNIDILIGVIELGLIFSIMSFGIYITFKVLNFPDLTVDGSFTLGSVVCAIMTINNHPIIGILLGVIAGVLAGVVTALLHTKLKVQYILAGILTMTALYSINLKIAQDKPNLSLFDTKTVYTLFDNILNTNYSKIILLLLIVSILIVLLHYFFKTQTGLALKATGNNEDMVKASSINTDIIKIIGLGLANGLVGLSAALFTQYQMFYDLSVGIGMMVVGLTAIIVGESIVKKKSIVSNLIATVLGAILYRLLLSITLLIGMNPNSWKLVCAVLVIVVISIPSIQNYLKQRRRVYAND